MTPNPGITWTTRQNIEEAATALTTLARTASSMEATFNDGNREEDRRKAKEAKEKEKRAREQKTAFADGIYVATKEFDGHNDILKIKKFISDMESCVKFYAFESEELAYLKVLGKLSASTTACFAGYINVKFKITGLPGGHAATEAAMNGLISFKTILDWVETTYSPANDTVSARSEMASLWQHEWEYIQELSTRMNTLASRIGGIRTDQDNNETLINAIQPASLQTQIRQQVTLARMTNSDWTYQMTLQLAIETEKMSADNWDPTLRQLIPKPDKEACLKKKLAKVKSGRISEADKFIEGITPPSINQSKLVPPIQLPCRYCTDFGHDFRLCPDKHEGKPPRNKDWHTASEIQAFKEKNQLNSKRTGQENNRNSQVRMLKKRIKSLSKSQTKKEKKNRVCQLQLLGVLLINLHRQ